jgi:hypothetical protein
MKILCIRLPVDSLVFVNCIFFYFNCMEPRVSSLILSRRKIKFNVPVLFLQLFLMYFTTHVIVGSQVFYSSSAQTFVESKQYTWYNFSQKTFTMSSYINANKKPTMIWQALNWRSEYRSSLLTALYGAQSRLERSSTRSVNRKSHLEMNSCFRCEYLIQVPSHQCRSSHLSQNKCTWKYPIIRFISSILNAFHIITVCVIKRYKEDWKFI